MQMLASTISSNFGFLELVSSGYYQSGENENNSTNIFRKATQSDRIAFNDNILIIDSLDSPVWSNATEKEFEDSNTVEQLIINDNKRINLNIINNKIDIIESIGDDWDNDGLTKGPNDFSIKFSREIAFQIIENNFMPLMITQSIEEGICFVFKSNNKYLYIN